MNSIGDLNCGIPSNEIPSIQPAQFCPAMSTIGALSTCEPSQLTEYAALVKKCNIGPDSAKWSPSDIASMGAILGGTTKGDLSKLNKDQIQAIQQFVIPLIPNTQFADFSIDQLGYMTDNQLAVMTRNQFQSLDASKQKTIADRLTMVKADLNVDPSLKPPGSSCSGLAASALPVLTVILGLLLQL